MTDEALEYRVITVGELVEFATSMAARGSDAGLNPIPLHVAEAHAANPDAEPGDLARVVLFDGDKCVGYCGAFPGRLSRGRELHKVSYPTSLFIDPEYRSLGPALKLMRQMFDQDVDVVGATMSDLNRAVLKRIGVHGRLGPRRDVTIEPLRLHFKVRALADKLRKVPAVGSIAARLLGRFAYPLLRALFHLGFGLTTARAGRRHRFREVSQVPDDALPVPTDDTTIRLRRGPAIVNWQLAHPWILSETDTDARYPSYHFRSVVPFFRTVAVEVSSPDGGTQGHVVLSVRTNDEGTTLKILDHTPTRQVRDAIPTLISRYGRRHDADVVICDASLRELLASRRMLRPFLGDDLNEYAVKVNDPDGPLSGDDPDVELSICDADMAFV